MKKKEILNLEMVVAIKVFDKTPAHYWCHIPFQQRSWLGRKLFGGDQKEGFRQRYGEKIFTREQMNGKYHYGDELMVEGEDVFYKPKVKLIFAGEYKYTEFFKTLEEATTWANEQAKNGIKIQYVKEY